MTSRRFDDAARAIARLQRRVDGLELRSSRIGHEHALPTGTVKARSLSTTITTFATAARTVSTNIVIPASWVTYDVEIGFTFDLQSTSANNRGLTVEPQFDSAAVAGQVWAITAPAGSVVQFNDVVSGTGFFTGLTATGTRTGSIVLILNVVDTAVSSDDVALIVTAYRTT